jgi:Ca-activated chloride channel homolog
MMTTLLAPHWLYALWAIPLLVAIALLGIARRRAAMRRYFAQGVERHARDGARRRSLMLRSVLGIAGMGLTILALARPADNPRPREAIRKGRDVVFVVDVSRSMLAEDLRPSRLERAKLMVQDCIDSAHGDRIGLVAFAGMSQIASPLTTDYSFLSLAVRELSPETVGVGGTDIGDALTTVLDRMFEHTDGEQLSTENYRDIILITDGEDHGTLPQVAAAEAAKRGVRIITVGLGDETTGTMIDEAPSRPGATSTGRPMQYGGKPVLSKLDPKLLRDLAEATPGGTYVHVGTSNVELDRVYQRLVRDGSRRELAAATSMQYDERFQWFIGAALFVLVLREFIRER